MAAIDLSYLIAAVLFIVGLKKLSSPATARAGNFLAACGMLIAILATLIAPDPENPGTSQIAPTTLWLILAGIVVGSGIGLYLARTVKMTAIPQMVAIFNGFGGGASAVVAAAEYNRLNQSASEVATELTIPFDTGIAIQLGAVVGSLTLSGSIVAFGKLQELITGQPITYPLQRVGNFLLFALLLAGMVYIVVNPERTDLFMLLCLAALVFGVLFVIPIGGADMPVVISLLNSFSGLAAAITGFVIMNSALIISGALVGAAGLILTKIMCKAMNRPLTNVLFSAFGKVKSGGAQTASDQTAAEISHADCAVLMTYARSVIIVPGYGLAVAQAQHRVRELATFLEKHGVDVKYAIHPVAGRMPGHMNVLLAEADVPYDQLYDMDQINSEFARADVALVIGANDVVNPAARSDPQSPIYGMPILNVDHAAHCIVMKRSMNPGFAGISNQLFFEPKTKMLFGDAKASLTTLLKEAEEL